MTAQEKTTKKKDEYERQVVVFKLADEEFGVNISEVKEIIRIELITKIPNSAEYIKGVINLRGKIIVIVDLALVLGLPPKKTDNETRIIVIELEESTIGMIVDSATEVLRLSSNQIEAAPQIITKKINADYIEGVGMLGERLLILLDLIKVLKSEDISIIKQVTANMETKAN
jgi:purine-binding chemotaxis protein CheW